MEEIRQLFCNTIGLKENHYVDFMHLAKLKSLDKNENLIEAGSTCNF
jgi:hypothetical protein